MSRCGPRVMSNHHTFDPRQEPGAVILHAGIRAGGGGQPPSLPRPSAMVARCIAPKASGKATDAPINARMNRFFRSLNSSVFIGAPSVAQLSTGAAHGLADETF